MVGAADVVARDDGDEGGCAVQAGGLYAAESVRLDGGGRAVAVALGLHAGVDAGGVAAPELDVCVGYGLAAGGVDDVDVEVGDGALFACEDVLSDELASDPWSKLGIHMEVTWCCCLQYGPSVASGSSVQAASTP
jgi:hypothetical protein